MTRTLPTYLTSYVLGEEVCPGSAVKIDCLRMSIDDCLSFPKKKRENNKVNCIVVLINCIVVLISLFVDVVVWGSWDGCFEELCLSANSTHFSPCWIGQKEPVGHSTVLCWTWAPFTGVTWEGGELEQTD